MTSTNVIIGTEAVLDRKIDEICAGLQDSYANNLRSLSIESNIVSIVNYIYSMKTEINPADSYRKELIKLLCNFSGFISKDFKDTNRDDVVHYLDSFRKTETADPLHKWIGTYNLFRIHLIRFFKWLYAVTEVRQRKKYTIEDKQKLRFHFLLSLYETTDSVPSRIIDAVSLATKLGLDVLLLRQILEYLVQKRLVKVRRSYYMFNHVFPTFYDISITSKGVEEIEKAQTHPNRATRNFSARVTNSIIMNITNTVFQRDSFNNIKGSTIINESQVQNASEKLFHHYRDEEGRQALLTLAEAVKNFQNSAAVTILLKLMEELNKTGQDKETLKEHVSAIGIILPKVSEVRESISKLMAIFNS